METIQGIYRIRNLTNNKVYIGSGGDINNRWTRHRSRLRGRCHFNNHIQRAWNLYGEDNFIFEKVEDVLREEDLIVREQWYLDNVVRWGYDYNKAKDATAPMRGGKHSEETRDKMSNAQRGKKGYWWGKHRSEETKRKMSEAQSGENHPNWGECLSKETKRKMSEAKRGEKSHLSKLIEEDVLEIRRLFDSTKHLSIRYPDRYTHKKLGKMFGVERVTIGSIINRKTWKHL